MRSCGLCSHNTRMFNARLASVKRYKRQPERSHQNEYGQNKIAQNCIEVNANCTNLAEVSFLDHPVHTLGAGLLTWSDRQWARPLACLACLLNRPWNADPTTLGMSCNYGFHIIIKPEIQSAGKLTRQWRTLSPVIKIGFNLYNGYTLIDHFCSLSL